MFKALLLNFVLVDFLGSASVMLRLQRLWEFEPAHLSESSAHALLRVMHL